MIFYPKAYIKKVSDITLEFLQQHHIKGIILDVDNTLIDYEKEFGQGIEEWIQTKKAEGIRFCIVSNSYDKEKVGEVAAKLELPYFYFGTKPFKRGFKKAIEQLDLPENQIATIGDQVFTDVIGANRCKLFPILVKPLVADKTKVGRIKRKIESKIIQKYQQGEKGNVHK